MTAHDPYLTQSIEALGRERVIIVLQHEAAFFHKQAVEFMNDKRFNYLGLASYMQRKAAWASRNARILMGIE